MQRLGPRLAVSMMLVSALSVAAVVAGLYLFSRHEAQRTPSEFRGALAEWRAAGPPPFGAHLRPPTATALLVPSEQGGGERDPVETWAQVQELLEAQARGESISEEQRQRIALLLGSLQDAEVQLRQARERAQVADARVLLVAQGHEQVLTAQWRGIGAGLAVAVLLSMLLAWWLSRSVARPVEAVGAAATALAQGQLSQRVTVPTSPLSATAEVTRLAGDFNRMADSLERYEGERQAMIADIAHELRTPLTAMTLRLEALSDGLVPLSTEEVDRLRHQAGLLHRLVEDLRTLSLADAGRLELRSRRLDLLSLSQDVVANSEVSAGSQGVRLEVQAAQTPGPMVDGDPDRLAQVLGNLLDNAIRVTPSGGRVLVEVAREGGEAVWHVRDDGPGIPAKDLPEIFERFRQGAEGRRDLRGSSGLGLAIVRTLVELHGGRVSASNLPAGGAELTVHLPAID